jgi:nucleoside 2-deoxyribosyltransferase
MTKLYLAGPLFTLAEQSFNADLARFLKKQGLEVWLPQEHEPRRKKGEGRTKGIFRMDVEAMDWADMIIACMDGPDPDSGTAWECGYAFAKGKPVVCYRTDFSHLRRHEGSALQSDAQRKCDNAVRGSIQNRTRAIPQTPARTYPQSIAGEAPKGQEPVGASHRLTKPSADVSVRGAGSRVCSPRLLDRRYLSAIVGS